MSEVIEKFSNIKVVGIAGPGEPLYNKETFETYRLIKGRFPHLHHCVSTNGLLLLEKLEEIEDVGVTNVTVTLNALKDEIAEKIYSFISFREKIYRGREGAQILIRNQLAGIEGAVRRGLTVKVNTVLIPGINDHHVIDIAQKARKLGVYIHNIMPLIPQYLLSHVTPPTPGERKSIQDECAKIIPQMRHCRQCRADAVGKLDEELPSGIYGATAECSLKNFNLPKAETEGEKVRVAVATSGLTGLVDLHFGHTNIFSIYEVSPSTLSIQFLGKRKVEEAYCKGPECDLPSGQEDLLKKIIDLLKDCKFLLCRRIGDLPATQLKQAGIITIEDVDKIWNAIPKIFSGKSSIPE